MEQYYDKNQTPLKFHKFLWYFGLPVSFIVTLMSIVRLVYAKPVYNWMNIVDIAVAILSLPLMLISFIGFCKWQSYGW